jgi:XTP/dITP diphosphohydrolase
MKLVVASANRGKLIEIASILDSSSQELMALGDIVPGWQVEESGESFLDNARLKATAAFRWTGLPSVADDSGLCVVGLGLAPGIRSSRYAGEGKSDADRVAALLQAMAGLDGRDRVAWFECVAYAVLPRRVGTAWQEQPPEADRPELLCFEETGVPGFVGLAVQGRLMGRIGLAARGTMGFGYDPVFLPDADPSRTLAEFTMEEKNAVSHRAQAFGELSRLLRLDRIAMSGNRT